MSNTKRILFIVITLSGLLIGLALLFVAGINHINWNAHDEFVKKRIEAASGFEVVTLEGFHIHIGRKVVMSVDSLVLRGRDNQKLQSLAFEDARFRGGFQLLWQPSLLLDSLAIKKMDVNLQQPFLRDRDDLGDALKSFAWLPRVFVQDVQIEDGRITIDQMTGQPPLEIHLNEVRVSENNNLQKTSLLAQGHLNGLSFKWEGEFGSKELYLDDDFPFPVDLKASFGSDDAFVVNIDGQILAGRSGSKIRVELPKGDVNPLLKALHYRSGVVAPLSASLEILQTGNALEAHDLHLQLGKTVISGKVRLDLSKDLPFLQAELQSGPIFLQDLASLAPVFIRSPSTSVEQFYSQRAFPLGLMRGLNAEIVLASKKPKSAQSGDIDAVDIRTVLRDGKLQVEPLKYKFAEGTFTGRMSAKLDRDLVRATMNLDVRGLNPDRALQGPAQKLPVFDVKPSELVQGEVMSSLELSSYGRNPEDLARHSKGKMQFALENGRLSKAVSKAFGFQLGEAFVRLFADRPLAHIECMMSSFKGENGMFRTHAFVVSTREANIEGRGTLDIGAAAVDLRFESKPRRISVGMKPVPIRISGNFTELSIDIDKPQKENQIDPDTQASFGERLAELLPFVVPAAKKESSCQSYLSTLAEINRESQDVSKTRKKQGVVR